MKHDGGEEEGVQVYSRRACVAGGLQDIMKLEFCMYLQGSVKKAQSRLAYEPTDPNKGRPPGNGAKNTFAGSSTLDLEKGLYNVRPLGRPYYCSH